MPIKRLPLLLTAFCLLVTASVGWAQSSTATLSGTIEDERGALIPGAAIAVVNEATSFKRTATTNESGSFTIPLLPPGEYTVLVEREGFTRVQLTNIVLNVGDQKAVQVQLKVGDIASTVEVRANETLVRTDGAVGTTVDRTFVSNLPLNGRSFQSLILLTPGVVVTTATGTNPGQFSVNGQRSNANYFTVDGVSANTGVNVNLDTQGISQALAGAVPGVTAFGGTNGLVSVDALEEFKIQTSTYSAEFGRQPGGQVSLVTRSGTNEFHGSFFDYLRNDAFDSNDWFANAAGRGKAPLRQNQFGGTFSGPVVWPRFGEGGRQPGYHGRNRTFFFFSYEGLRMVLPKAAVITVPSLRLRGVAAPAVRPLLAAFPLPDGPELLDASGQPTGVSRMTGVYSDPSTLNATSIRIDHTLNKKLTLFGRFNDAPSNTVTRGTSLSSVTENEASSRSLTLGATMAMTAKLSNELRFNLSRDRLKRVFNLDDFGGAVPIDLSAIIPDLDSKGANVGGQLIILLPSGSGLLMLGSSSSFTQRQMNLVDNVSWVKGGHQLKFGIDYRRLAPITSPVGYFQQVIFNSETQLRTGTAGIVNVSSQQPARPLFTNISLYAQDRWKLSQRLSLDLGLRWEINPAPRDADGKKPIGVIGVDNLPTATLAPPDTPMYKTYYGAFAPRIGMAYQLSGTQGWERVVRAGVGVFYDMGSGQAATGFQQFPFVLSNPTLRNVPFPITPAQAVPPPPPVVRLPIVSNLSALNPDLRLPYTLQWNVSVEQSLGPNQTVSASYVAAAARRLLTRQVLNQVTPSGLRPNPNFGTVLLIYNAPTSDYESLQLQFQRRLTQGLQALVNYTWSHAIDEVSEEATFLVLERGNAAFDTRHNLSAAITYNLPGRGLGGIVGRLLGNWSVDAIGHAQSAPPVDLSAGSFVREDGHQFSVRPDLVAGQPLYIKDPTVAGGRRINSAAFQRPPVGPNGQPLRQGTLGRNVLRGLPLYQVDLALRRQFNLIERLNLQFRAEAFNLFNHPNFGGVVTTVLTPSTFGVPTQMLGRSLGGLSPLYQIGGPRSLQFSLRIGF